MLEPRAMETRDFWTVFNEHAAERPALEAILAPGRSPLSFSDLTRRLDGVRASLEGFGIGRGDVVALALPNGPEMAVCVLGVASSAIAAPLNPSYGDREFAHYLARLRPKAVVVPADEDSPARRQAAACGIPTIELCASTGERAGTFELQCDARGAPARPGWNTADDVAVLLLTSGSTDQPKLVPHRSRHVAAYAEVFARAYQLGPADRCIHTMPMFHGHGLESLLLVPLLRGGGVVCPTGFDVPSFFAQIRTFQPTWYSAAYTIHHAILDGIEPYRETAREARLRFIRSGSGRLDPAIMRGLEDAFGAPVVERYGMSEAPTLTYNPLPPAVRKAGTVGIPTLCEVRVREGREFLATGQEGEVVARGPLVFDGYWDDPEATDAAFVDGWFRTGDLGRFDDDGYLTITGRLKDVINRGGEKLSPAEVEQVLCEHPDVAAACVFAVPHPTLGEEVMAAFVPEVGSDVAERDLLGHVRERVVRFKVPRRILPCSSLPTGSSGKVQRAAVAQMCRALLGPNGAEDSAASPRAPSALENEVLQIWNAVLKSRSTDLDQDFFLAGGDSLAAAELFVRIHHQLGISLNLGEFFDHATTVAGIAGLVERARGAGGTARVLPARLVPIKPEGDRRPLFGISGRAGNPLAFVHFARSMDPRRPFYGIASVGLDGTTAPLDRMEDIAAENIRVVRALQPTGPYSLCGLCFGARVAYEMARQLEAGGEEVELLLMLDPSPPYTDGAGRPRGPLAAKRKRYVVARIVHDHVLYHAKNVARLRGAERRTYVREKFAKLSAALRQGSWSRRYRTELRRRAVEEANYRAGMSYVPEPYAGPAVIRFSRDRPILGGRDHRLDWLALLPQCEGPIYVPGHDSGSMVDSTHAPHLAALVNDATEQMRT